MKYFFFLLLLFVSGFVLGQEPVDSYKAVSAVNDSTWKVETYNVYEFEIVFNEVEYPIEDTLIDLSQTVYFDSTGIIDYLVNTTYNEQLTQSAIVSKSFDVTPTLRGPADANNQIESISGGESNYFEEVSKRQQNRFIGRYRLFFDSAGVQKTEFAELTLLTNVNHPDGRILRLTVENGETFNVQPYSRWSLNIPTWPYSNETRFTWHRSKSTSARPVFRPWDYQTRLDTYTRIVKVD